MAGQLVHVYFVHSTRSRGIAEAFAKGCRLAGDRPRLIPEHEYRGDIEKEPQVAAFYGLNGQLAKIFNDYRRTRRTVVFADLGYFGRRVGGRYVGYHKITVNDRHPTAYFQRVKHDRARRAFGIEVKPWQRSGEAILLAGMGDKAAQAVGLAPAQWEQEMIVKLSRVSKRTIIYRPKPSWDGAERLNGAEFSPKSDDISRVLPQAHCVVTHHSNVGVDALIAGVPVFTWEGAAMPLSLQDISRIEEPLRPDDHAREQWLNDLHYCQWSVDEIAKGLPWAHLKNEGLIP
jgi:hypothetical protein